jgi:hypothetical protein
MKKSIRENSGSEVDLIDSHYVILEIYNIIKNQPLSLTDRVVIDNPLLYWYLT